MDVSAVGKLIICPTPLGNLGDMTKRAEEALRSCDAVLAEDTRVTARLLGSLGIEGASVERLDENLMEQRASGVVSRVLDGQVIAYCTDAGMPGVSDPGLRLVRAARAAGAAVEVLPGPTAVATAYVASGCSNAAFYFGGFFPRKDAARRQLLESLAQLDAALIFYESPKRLASSLAVIAQVFPLREACVCRELTKLHEEVLRAPTGDLSNGFAARESIKGEIVIVIDGPSEKERDNEASEAAQDAQERALELVGQGMRPKEAARVVSEELGIARNAAYELALAAKREL